METAIVIDSSIQFPAKWYDLYHIYPIGYVVRDSDGNKHLERETITALKTEELRELLIKDKNAELLAPSVKDFVELYTFLSENFEHVISVHSSLFTPAVFENAILAKKLVSEVTIDIIDTHTFAAASSLFMDYLSHTTLAAQKINDIRKAAISYDKYIQAFIIAKNDLLNIVGIRKTTWLTGLTVAFRPNVLYNYYQSQWKELARSRSTKRLINEINTRINLFEKVKEPVKVYMCGEGESLKLKESFIGLFEGLKIVEVEPSLVSSYLLNHDFFSIAIF